MSPNWVMKMKQSLIALLIAIIACVPAFANPVIPIPTQPQQPTFTPGTPKIDATGYILIDANSGKILAQKEADTRMPPASLTKLMSLYIISSALKNGQIHMEDKVRISTKAWKTEGSRMFVKVGDEVPLKDLIQGIIVASGNDATVALAEHIAGTEETFTNMMNQQAKLLGMNNSHFTDSTGLPNQDHYSTPHDLAILTQAYIKNFPEDYGFYSEKWFTYNGIRQPNRNRLLWRYQYADGLKTGHTSEAGYCLVASAKKDGMRLISVVMGAPNDQARTEDSIRLMTYGFRFFETHKLYNASTPLVKARVWKGEKTETPLGLTEDLYVTVPTGQYKRLQATLALNNPIKAPIVKGHAYGTVNIMLNNQVVASKPLVALDSNPQGGLLRRLTDSVKYTIHKYFTRTDEKVNTG
ncbi:D-alanyl-D-alanine carboxypeptidase family protein [Aquicella lusitana]|uniref:serine-type D-Ala-D-Ala carboxypeptidase n=1 Tax=Aquicella lusitana TaxID=254246 RepID=A0A370GN34_9COXI|nr:D-alanyl-D-alanine carboxypeptidase family protein [Aquicella lusitana]RDI45142.1 penicillin-binding protein 6 [Aquicella lusitana]VVC72788.1 D-alanyl-D-alanine carboxypeptidase DacC [Aquicella lusitana]